MSGQRAASSSSPELDQMMQRIRHALRDQRGTSYPKVDRAVLEHELPNDCIKAFTDRAQVVGMHVHHCEAAAIEGIVRSILGNQPPNTVVVDPSLLPSLPGLAADISMVSDPTRVELYNADCGIVQMQGAIAATGSVIRTSGPGRPRAFALVPPMVIGILDERDILRDLIDWFDRESNTPPTDVAFITGPSKTADIGMQLVTGIHGPGEVHIIIIVDHHHA